MPKTYRDHPSPIGVRLSRRNQALMDGLKLPHINRSSLINRALDFGLERAIRELSKAISVGKPEAS